MKITINAFGTRGDIQPYLALGLGLVRAGHSIRILTHRIFEPWVRQYGFDYCLLEIDPRQVMVSQAVADLGSNFFRISAWMKTHFQTALKDIFKATLAAADGADVLLNSTLSFAGFHVAEKLGVPAIAAYLQPATPTSYSPSSTGMFPPAFLPFKGFFNYASTKLANQFFFNILLPLNNACRAEILGLRPMNSRDYWPLDSPKSKTPILYGFSPAVVPKPPDWGAFQQITGYWFLDEAADYQPPPDLMEFLDQDPKPVYIGFGSMVDHERADITRLIVKAVEMAGQRAVLLGGWSALGSASAPESIYQIKAIPHSWLFPRVKAVVHHGGAGTTASGLRAGAPTVVVPFFADQHFWGWRVHQLNAGPPPLPRKRLDAEGLSKAIEMAVTHPAMQATAARLGARITAEDGVNTAVKMIERYTRSRQFED